MGLPNNGFFQPTPEFWVHHGQAMLEHVTKHAYGYQSGGPGPPNSNCRNSNKLGPWCGSTHWLKFEVHTVMAWMEAIIDTGESMVLTLLEVGQSPGSMICCVVGRRRLVAPWSRCNGKKRTGCTTSEASWMANHAGIIVHISTSPSTAVNTYTLQQLQAQILASWTATVAVGAPVPASVPCIPGMVPNPGNDTEKHKSNTPLHEHTHGSYHRAASLSR